MDYRAIVDAISYPHVSIRVYRVDNEDTELEYLQVRGEVWDEVTRVYRTVSGRKWLLSRHMTETEVVQTAFLAVKTWGEHETRENFRYRGDCVFSPHIDVNAVADLVNRTTPDKRVDNR